MTDPIKEVPEDVLQAERPRGTTHTPGTDTRDSAALLRELLSPWWSVLLALAVCVLAPLSLVAVHIHENPMFSPQDEAAHYDYVNRIAAGELPRLGDRLELSTMEAISCRGIAYPGIQLPPCGDSHVRADQYPGGGYQYEAQEPPTYYAITAAVRWLPEHVLGLGEVTATRSVGALWLITGLILSWIAGRLMGIEPRLLAVGVLLLASAPVTLYEASIVSNGAASVACGGLIAAVGAYVWRTHMRRGWILLSIAACFVTAVQLTDSFPAAVLAVLFIGLAYAKGLERAELSVVVTSGSARRSWIPKRREYAIWALALVGGIGVAAVGWQLAFHALSTINPRELPTFAFLRKGPLGLSLVAEEALNLLTPLTQGFTSFRSSASLAAPISFASGNLQVIFGTLLGFLLIAAAAAGAFVNRRRWDHWVGLLTLGVLYAGGIAVGVGFWRTYGANPGLIGRYGLSMGPFLAVVLVAALRGRWAKYCVAVFSVATFVLTFYFMLAG